jgi:kinesin family protein 11
MKLRAEAKQYQTEELEILASQSERIDVQLQNVQDALQVIQSKDSVSSEAIAAIQTAVTETQESFKNGYIVWSETLNQSCGVICKELQTNGISGLTTVSLSRYNTDVKRLIFVAGAKCTQGNGFSYRYYRP